MRKSFGILFPFSSVGFGNVYVVAEPASISGANKRNGE